jgi:hypothetical protein
MHGKARFPNVNFSANLRPDSAALAILIMLLFLLLVLLFMTLIAQPVQAQAYQVLHNFTSGADGAYPGADLMIDSAGNIYGTTVQGSVGYGTVFKLTHKGSGWVVNPLYSFADGNDGDGPSSAVIFGADGSLYGTTRFGGGDGCSGRSSA